jgi:hypothetical protein
MSFSRWSSSFQPWRRRAHRPHHMTNNITTNTRFAWDQASTEPSMSSSRLRYGRHVRGGPGRGVVASGLVRLADHRGQAPGTVHAVVQAMFGAFYSFVCGERRIINHPPPPSLATTMTECELLHNHCGHNNKVDDADDFATKTSIHVWYESLAIARPLRVAREWCSQPLVEKATTTSQDT